MCENRKERLQAFVHAHTASRKRKLPVAKPSSICRFVKNRVLTHAARRT